MIIAAMLVFAASGLPADEPVYPLKISSSGRYFVDQQEAPTFWLGTTQWQLCHDNTLEDVRTTLVGSKRHGFNVALVMLLGLGDGSLPNLKGEQPWTSLDPLVPNEAYFQHVDAVLQIAREENMVIALMPYHQRWRQALNEQNARGFAKWLAERYKDVPTLLWSLCPEQKDEFIPVLRELAAGLREGDGGSHLITVHPDPSPCTSSFIHTEPWLDFNSIQVWKYLDRLYPMMTYDYALTPTKPLVMAEGVYEAGRQYKMEITLEMIRGEAYASYLLGGHHVYGHYDGYHLMPTWKEALDSPGAQQMEILKKFFQERSEWWKLIPDQSLLVRGGKTEGTVLNLAARHPDGRWGIVYLGEPTTITLDLSKFVDDKFVNVTWIDPRDGVATSKRNFAARGAAEFTTPDGWKDALLLLESPGRT